MRWERLINAEGDHAEVDQAPDRKRVSGRGDYCRIFVRNYFWRNVVDLSRRREIVYKNNSDGSYWNKELSELFIHIKIFGIICASVWSPRFSVQTSAKRGVLPSKGGTPNALLIRYNYLDYIAFVN